MASRHPAQPWSRFRRRQFPWNPPLGHKNAPHPQSEVKGKPDALGAGRGFRQTQKDPGKFRNTRGREQDLSEYPQPVLRDSWKCVGIHP